MGANVQLADLKPNPPFEWQKTRDTCRELPMGVTPGEIRLKYGLVRRIHG